MRFRFGLTGREQRDCDRCGGDGSADCDLCVDASTGTLTDCSTGDSTGDSTDVLCMTDSTGGDLLCIVSC